MSAQTPTPTDVDPLPTIDAVTTFPTTVDLAEIDIDFIGEESRHTDLATVRAAGGMLATTASAADLKRVDLFRHVADIDCAAFATQVRLIRTVPGSVLQPAGQTSDKIFFVISGELRLYADLKEKRARGIVDAGQSVGLTWALLWQPTEVAIIATEVAQVLELRLAQLEEFARRSHAFACNVNALYAAYLRGDNCLNVGARALAALHQRRGYTDELTQLHNEQWLTAMLPRLLGRQTFDATPLTVAMFAVDNLESIEHEFGTIAGEQILAGVAQVLLNVARTTDLLACDGDRCFLAILPNTTVDGGRLLGQRLLEDARLLRIDATDEQPLPALTLSAGVLQCRAGMSAVELRAQLRWLVQRSMDNGGNVVTS